MVHFTQTDDQEPDYLFVVNNERKEILLNQLKSAFLDPDNSVKSFVSSENGEHLIVVIYFPKDVLDKMAEIVDLECKLQDSQHSQPFKTYANDLFERFQAR